MSKKIIILNYGCTANYNHGEIMAGTLKDKGYIIAENLEEADIVVINSCIVKSVTENKIKSKMRLITKLHPSKMIIFTGCGADAEKSIFEEVNRNLIFVSSHHLDDIINAIESEKNFLGLREEHKLLKMKLKTNELVNIVEISQGCLGECTFCITKTARGKLHSYDKTKIIEDIKKSLKEGCKEIWLTSQDCGCYGLDKGDNICNLLNEIIEIKGDFRVRLGMSNPQFIKMFSEELSIIFKNEKMFKFLHLPVQSGSDKILNLMKRGHSASDFNVIIENFRRHNPNIAISTDIIAGFPEETDEDFEKSISLLEKTMPDIINISKFGARPGTLAKEMKQVDSKIVKERTTKLGRIVKGIAVKKNKKWIGQKCTIIIDEKGKTKGQWTGRNESYRPVIVSSKKNIFGKYVYVKIVDSSHTHLKGEIIKE